MASTKKHTQTQHQPYQHFHSSLSLPSWKPWPPPPFHGRHHHTASPTPKITPPITLSSRSFIWYNSRAIWTTLTPQNRHHRHINTTFHLFSCWVFEENYFWSHWKVSDHEFSLVCLDLYPNRGYTRFSCWVLIKMSGKWCFGNKNEVWYLGFWV